MGHWVVKVSIYISGLFRDVHSWSHVLTRSYGYRSHEPYRTVPVTGRCQLTYLTPNEHDFLSVLFYLFTLDLSCSV